MGTRYHTSSGCRKHLKVIPPKNTCPFRVPYKEDLKRSGDVTAIDATTGKVVGSIESKGNGEGIVSTFDGLLFVNQEDTYKKTKKVFLPAAEFDVTAGTDPSQKLKRTLKVGFFGVLVLRE